MDSPFRNGDRVFYQEMTIKGNGTCGDRELLAHNALCAGACRVAGAGPFGKPWRHTSEIGLSNTILTPYGLTGSKLDFAPERKSATYRNPLI